MGLTIQTHPDRFEAVPYLAVDDPFVVVRAHEDDASVSLFLRAPADCDALIAAAVEAKRLLDPPVPPDSDWEPITVPGPHPDASADRHGYAPDESQAATA
jgi:hypothetical protein